MQEFIDSTIDNFDIICTSTQTYTIYLKTGKYIFFSQKTGNSDHIHVGKFIW